MVLGMAMGGYGYDPAASRSDVATVISDDIATHTEETVDPDTTRNRLREAKEKFWPREKPAQ
jgi:hypothetical protein